MTPSSSCQFIVGRLRCCVCVHLNIPPQRNSHTKRDLFPCHAASILASRSLSRIRHVRPPARPPVRPEILNPVSVACRPLQSKGSFCLVFAQEIFDFFFSNLQQNKITQKGTDKDAKANVANGLCVCVKCVIRFFPFGRDRLMIWGICLFTDMETHSGCERVRVSREILVFTHSQNGYVKQPNALLVPYLLL